jgi:hypothetical protein
MLILTENLETKIKTNFQCYELLSINFNSHIDMVHLFSMKNNKRRSEWGKGWDGRSRIPDETYKKNYDEIDWSSTKKKKPMDDIIEEAIKYDIKN